MKGSIIRNKTIEQLERNSWNFPEYESHLAIACYSLTKKIIKHFTAGDLRIMLTQNLYPEYLLIEALDKLKENPWIEGDFYEGDLLNSVLRLKKEVWQKHKKEHKEVKIIVEKVKIDLINNQELSKISKQAIIDALKFFEEKN